jgi:hypothetical protein
LTRAGVKVVPHWYNVDPLVYVDETPLIGTLTDVPMGNPLLVNCTFTEGTPVPDTDAAAINDVVMPTTIALKGKPRFIPLAKIGAESTVDMKFSF